MPDIVSDTTRGPCVVYSVLDTIEDVPRYPSCHVIERGDFTLTEVLKEKRLPSTRASTILYHVV